MWVVPEEFVENQFEAMVSGLLFLKFVIGMFKLDKIHPFIEPDFNLSLISKDHLSAVAKKE
jgi:leucyl aminopeptidase